MESATRYEARKYIAVVHKLLAEAAYARDDFAEAEKQLGTALDRLAGFPTPIVTWMIYSMLGRVRLQLGDSSAAEAFEEASAIVQLIAANVEEETLRTSFLAAPAVQEVIARGSARDSG